MKFSHRRQGTKLKQIGKGKKRVPGQNRVVAQQGKNGLCKKKGGKKWKWEKPGSFFRKRRREKVLSLKGGRAVDSWGGKAMEGTRKKRKKKKGGGVSNVKRGGKAGEKPRERGGKKPRWAGANGVSGAKSKKGGKSWGGPIKHQNEAG
ncbi:hypothetical protein RKK42_31250 [Klebsiella pneumoniae]|nr:hypothetical protein [Klebsiella pneumoniae]